MSLEAMAWVLNEAPGLPSHAFGVLMGLANHADKFGLAAFPSQATLALYARKSARQVRRDLDDLQEVGLIRHGDPRHVAHIPADERPIVWDLAMEKQSSAAPKPKRKARGSGRTRPVVDDRPDADDRPDVDDRSLDETADQMAERTPTSGRTSTAEGADAHVLLTVLEPTTEEVLRTSSKPAPKGAPTTTKPKGTRIPDDFAVTDAMIAWFNEKTPTLDGPTQTDAFIDHWRADASAKAWKADWTAAWRTWMRNAVKWSSTPSVPGQRQSGGDKVTTGQQRLADAARIAEDMRRLDEAEIGDDHKPTNLFALPIGRIA